MCGIMFHMSRLFKAKIFNHLRRSLKIYFHLKSLWCIKWREVFISETKEHALLFGKKNYIDKGKEKKHDGKGKDSSSECGGN